MRSTSSPRAVSMMIGMVDVARRSRHSARPSSLGSMRSRMTRSKWSRASSARMPAPSATARTRRPCCERYPVSSSRSAGSSSTTRRVFSLVMGGSLAFPGRGRGLVLPVSQCFTPSLQNPGAAMRTKVAPARCLTVRTAESRPDERERAVPTDHRTAQENRNAISAICYSGRGQCRNVGGLRSRGPCGPRLR